MLAYTWPYVHIQKTYCEMANIHVHVHLCRRQDMTYLYKQTINWKVQILTLFFEVMTM